MKVSDLISKLQSLDPNLEVYCMTQEEGIFTSKDKNIRTFVVDDVYSIAVRQFCDSTSELVAEVLDSEAKHKIAAIEFSILVR